MRGRGQGDYRKPSMVNHNIAEQKVYLNAADIASGAPFVEAIHMDDYTLVEAEVQEYDEGIEVAESEVVDDSDYVEGDDFTLHESQIQEN